MKFREILLVAFIVVLVIFGVYGNLIKVDIPDATAQVFGTNYFWADSIYVTTAAIDCVYTNQWTQTTIYTDTSDIFFRTGASDTASWSSREWIKLPAGASIAFGPATPLKRFEFKTDAGVDYLYQVGYKRVAQY